MVEWAELGRGFKKHTLNVATWRTVCAVVLILFLFRVVFMYGSLLIWAVFFVAAALTALFIWRCRKNQIPACATPEETVRDNGFSTTVIVTGLALLALLLRFSWCLLVPPIPFSDFLGIYNASIQWSNGEFAYCKSTGAAMINAIIIKIFGPSLLFIYLGNAIQGALQTVMIYILGKNVFRSRRTGYIAALIWATMPLMIFYNGVVGTENPFITCMLLILVLSNCLFLHVRAGYIRVSTIIAAIALGIAGFLCFSTRTLGLLFVPMVICFILFMSGRNKKKVSFLILMPFIVSFGLAVLAQSYYVIYRKWRVRSLTPNLQSGYPIYFGTSVKHNGRWNIEDIAFVKSEFEKRHAGKRLSWCQREFLQSKIAKKLGMKRLKRDFWDIVAMGVTKKLEVIWGESRWCLNWPIKKVFKSPSKKYWPSVIELRLLVERYAGVLVVLALFGLVIFTVQKEKSAILMLIMCIIVLKIILHIFVEVQGRYQVPILPLYCLLAANCIYTCIRLLPAASKRITQLEKPDKHVTDKSGVKET
ncbi:MAG: hypothetical protein E3J72_21945 [Planctomycetota bacterium]|nr:MAG: hypothetical protein E3J72_21945 [Planctomycetota bacterium]